MALKLIRRAPVVETTVPAGADKDWVSWADGGNYGLNVDPGTYLVTVVLNGVEVANIAVWAGGKYEWVKCVPGVPVRMVFPDGAQLRMRATSPTGGTVTVKLDKVLPPPCVIARFWGGGHDGAKENQHHEHCLRSRLGSHPQKRGSGGGVRQLGRHRNHLAVATRGTGPRFTLRPRGGRGAATRYGEHRRQNLRLRHLHRPAPLRADHLPHLAPAGGEGRGA